MVALELLSGDFSDTVVRAFAVSYLSLIPDATVARYLQQIVQASQSLLFHTNRTAAWKVHGQTRGDCSAR